MADDELWRADLIAGLQGPDEADGACRLALESGAEFTVDPARVPVMGLIRTYPRRVQRMREKSIPTIGSDTVVARLEAFAGDVVRLALIHSASHDFVAFLDDQSKTVSCIGVRNSSGTPGKSADRR